MVKGEINAQEAYLNMAQLPVLPSQQTEKVYAVETTVEKTQIIIQSSTDLKIAKYYSRIKKRMRSRSTNIL